MNIRFPRPASLALAATTILASLAASAQSVERARPPGTIPLDEPAPPPPLVERDPALEPEVTVRTEDGRTIEEFRSQGRIYMVRVTPRHGVPYVLVDSKGDGTFTRQDNTLGPALRVPQWVLLEF